VKIRMLTIAVGPEINLDADKVYDLPDDQAKAFIKAGCAVPVAPETATKPDSGEKRA
jgi:hypothetical protein